MGGEVDDRLFAQSIESDNKAGENKDVSSKFFVDAYLNNGKDDATTGGAPRAVVRTGDRIDSTVSAPAEEKSGGITEWISEHPGTSTVIGLAAIAGLGYLTRGKWMPALSKLAPFADDAARVGVARTTGFDAAKAGLTTFSEVAHPELQAWKGALGYADVGLDASRALIYRGGRAGAFAADNVLVVNGTTEASTLFRALSREGLLERKVWERGAASGAAQLGEVKLPGSTRFIFTEGKTIDLPANSRLINLGNNEFHALTSDAAENLYKGLTMF